jgi:Uma2 family endonuclease
MSTTYAPPVSPEEYLVRERAAEYKSEYHGGEVVAMVGATGAHLRIVRGMVLALGPQVEGGRCEMFFNDCMVRLAEDWFVYPDIVVSCGGADLQDGRLLTNPTLVVEVLSPSTEKKDRGEKAEAYRAVPTMREYLLLAQNRVRAELYRREPDGRWECTVLQSLDDVLTLESIGCELRVADVYKYAFQGRQ